MVVVPSQDEVRSAGTGRVQGPLADQKAHRPVKQVDGPAENSEVATADAPDPGRPGALISQSLEMPVVLAAPVPGRPGAPIGQFLEMLDVLAAPRRLVVRVGGRQTHAVPVAADDLALTRAALIVGTRVTGRQTAGRAGERRILAGPVEVRKGRTKRAVKRQPHVSVSSSGCQDPVVGISLNGFVMRSSVRPPKTGAMLFLP